jgi:thioredoxin 1
MSHCQFHISPNFSLICKKNFVYVGEVPGAEAIRAKLEVKEGQAVTPDKFRNGYSAVERFLDDNSKKPDIALSENAKSALDELHEIDKDNTLQLAQVLLDRNQYLGNMLGKVKSVVENFLSGKKRPSFTETIRQGVTELSDARKKMDQSISEARKTVSGWAEKVPPGVIRYCNDKIATLRTEAIQASTVPAMEDCMERITQLLDEQKPGRIIELTDANFDAELLKKPGVSVVDFGAPSWCGPCNRMAPYLARVAKANEGKIRFAAVDTEENNALSSKYNISKLPTLVFFRNGREVGRMGGAKEGEEMSQLEAAVKRYS